ncbi:LysM peptidoglycan-binding domain-containing protein [Shinella sumterensis]|nr:LysM peptidoglycan-binding domain-containing protein [Shinella sumterensis]
MVSRPGEASRLITVPTTETAGTAAEGATATPAGETADKPATEPATETASADAGTAAGEQPAAGETASAAEDAATTSGDAATASAPEAVAKEAQARVSAVELEGRRMFIAGTAKPGALVRLYADDTLVGETKADEQGRFVADGTIDLSVGRHTIRADVMSADGDKVEFRASVPFDRPEGEQVAAVVAQDNATGASDAALGLIGCSTFDKLRGDADKALALLKGLFANGAVPSAEQLAAARSATEIALKSLAEFKPGEEEGDAACTMAAKASAAAADALARLRALPKDTAAVGAALGSIETAVADAVTPAIEKAQTMAENVAAAADGSVEALVEQTAAIHQKFVALFADGRNATAAEIQTGRSALEAALQKIVGFTVPADTTGDVATAIEKLKGWASTALDRLAAVPAGAGADAYRQALVALEGMPSLSAAAGAVETTTEGAAPATAGSSTAETAGSGTAATPAGGEAAAEEPETVEQAPLQASKTSVIIRRGDTLWQISRRIYGKGVRYTTIYLANEDQITDPDRILPGQVFGVPDKTVETDAAAEEMHRKHVRGN